MTFTGYKFPMDSTSRGVYFATLRGPFLRVVDEHSHFYKRGRPEPMDSHTAQLLRASPFHDVFLPSESPVALSIRAAMVDGSWKYRTTITISIDAPVDSRFALKRSPSSNHPPTDATSPSWISPPDTFPTDEMSCSSTGSCC